MKNYKLASLFILLILSACGGGGGSETPQSSVKPVTPVSPVYTSVTSSKNVFGAWLWYAKQLNKSHEQIASEMAAIGVKRIYIKIADGRDICSVKLLTRIQN